MVPVNLELLVLHAMAAWFRSSATQRRRLSAEVCRRSSSASTSPAITSARGSSYGRACDDSFATTAFSNSLVLSETCQGEERAPHRPSERWPPGGNTGSLAHTVDTSAIPPVIVAPGDAAQGKEAAPPSPRPPSRVRRRLDLDVGRRHELVDRTCGDRAVHLRALFGG
jgi:hypothetical protein